MKRRFFQLLPFVPAVLGAASLFFLVSLSKQPWQGAGLPVPARPGPIPEPVLLPPAGWKDWESFERGWPTPGVTLPLKCRVPTEPWTCEFMRRERKIWALLAKERTDPGIRTLTQLRQSIDAKCHLLLEPDRDISSELAVQVASPEESLAETLRRTADSAGLTVVPAEDYDYGYLTRSPRVVAWARTSPLVRIVKALRGEAPDTRERAWLALERPAPSPPAGEVDLRAVEEWIGKSTGLRVEYTAEALARLRNTPALQFPLPDEGDTIESCARVALVRAGLDVAARSGAAVICPRGEADAMAAGRSLTRAWTPHEWDEGLRQLASIDSEPVLFHSGQYPVANVIMMIAGACRFPVSADDSTWDEPVLIALPEGSYTVRELREQLWTTAGVKMFALKGSLWFVEPVAE